MTSKLRADLKRLNEDLCNTEKMFGLQTMKTQRENSPMPEIRPPWNYGGNCPMSMSHHSRVRNSSSRPGIGPICTRSRSPSRAGIRSPKNVVHKQTIDAGDKQTIVEVSVKTERRSRSSSVPRVPTEVYLSGKLSNVGISHQEPKKYDPLCDNPGPTSEVRMQPSWSNILSQKRHAATHADKVKRSCESSVTPYQKRKPVCLDHKTKFRDCQKSSGACTKEVHESDGNISSLGLHKKLKLLIRELKGNSLNNPNIQKIILDLEVAVNSLPSENLDPPVASLFAKTPSAQPTVYRKSNGPLSESPNMLSPSQHVDCQGQGSVTEPSLLRLSPDPLPSEQHLPKKKCSGSKGEAAPFIANFLNLLNLVTQSPSPPEDEHRSRKPHSKNERVFKEQLENACRVLEATCLRMEEDCEKLKKEKADMEKILRDKETELQTALSSRETMKRELSELRADLERANIELGRLQEEQAASSLTKEHENVIKDFEKRVEQLSEENRNLTIEMNMSRLEKEKLSVMLTNKMKEAERLKREINTVGEVHIVDVEDDGKQLDREESKKEERQKRKERQKNGEKNQGTTTIQSLKEDVSSLSLLQLQDVVRSPNTRFVAPHSKVGEFHIVRAEEFGKQVDREEPKKEERQKRNGRQRNGEKNQGTTTVQTLNEEDVPLITAGPSRYHLRRNDKQKEKQEKEREEVQKEKEKQENEEEHTNEENQKEERNKRTTLRSNDVSFVSEVQLPLYFLPVDGSWQKKTSSGLNLKIEKSLRPLKEPVPLGSPKNCYEIHPDGNCFFRCISLYLTGSEEMHEFVREAVVQFMVENQSEFEESNDPDYIEKMRTLKTWATEVEIRATAKWLKVPVFTYMRYNSSHWKWQRFGPGLDLTDDDSSIGGLYLKNTGSCHYDVVKEVYSSDYKKSP